MAAQKLTKGRLVQIIIMMMVLLTAFSWRTFNHEDLKEIDCSKTERCTLDLAGQKVTIIGQKKAILIQSEKNGILKIDQDQGGVAHKYGNWHVELNHKNNNMSLIFSLTSDETVAIVNF